MAVYTVIAHQRLSDYAVVQTLTDTPIEPGQSIRNFRFEFLCFIAGGYVWVASWIAIYVHVLLCKFDRLGKILDLNCKNCIWRNRDDVVFRWFLGPWEGDREVRNKDYRIRQCLNEVV